MRTKKKTTKASQSKQSKSYVPKHTHALHHQHTRKRIHVHHEVFPHTNKQKKLLDDAVYCAGLFAPIMTIPQLYNIWHYQDASGVSTITWTAYIITTSIWLFYGFVHKEKPIIVTNIVWLIVVTFIVIGSIMY